ncbi:MAG: hypothetical protein K1Y02_26035 [Candidatus Hydrogenedentes bacterium]|nr:hypothetical protein [Candidatus Hydrogenedentota bacterium]
MIGHNDLVLNEATMKQAVQLWIDSKFKGNSPIVKSVRDGRDGPCTTFTVLLSGCDDLPDFTKPPLA